jgi:hypothetical protein
MKRIVAVVILLTSILSVNICRADTITDLKARAYDILSNIEILQRQLQETNQAILKEMNKPEEVKA